METTIVYWAYIGIMEKKMGTKLIWSAGYFEDPEGTQDRAVRIVHRPLGCGEQVS